MKIPEGSERIVEVGAAEEFLRTFDVGCIDERTALSEKVLAKIQHHGVVTVLFENGKNRIVVNATEHPTHRLCRVGIAPLLLVVVMFHLEKRLCSRNGGGIVRNPTGHAKSVLGQIRLQHTRLDSVHGLLHVEAVIGLQEENEDVRCVLEDVSFPGLLDRLGVQELFEDAVAEGHQRCGPENSQEMLKYSILDLRASAATAMMLAA